MEKKSYETIENELALAKDALLNEVMHRQQLGVQLQDAAARYREFQSKAVRDLQEIRTAAKSQDYARVLEKVTQCIGPEPKEPEEKATEPAKAAK